MVDVLLGLFPLWLRYQLQRTQQQTAKSIENKYEDSREMSKNTSAKHHGLRHRTSMAELICLQEDYESTRWGSW